jgi:hypothetical protein
MVSARVPLHWHVNGRSDSTVARRVANAAQRTRTQMPPLVHHAPSAVTPGKVVVPLVQDELQAWPARRAMLIRAARSCTDAVRVAIRPSTVHAEVQTLCSHTHWLIPPHSRNLHVQTSPKHVGRRSAEHRHIEPLHASAVRYARTRILHARNVHRLRPAGTVRSAAAAFATARVTSPIFIDRMCATTSTNAAMRKPPATQALSAANAGCVPTGGRANPSFISREFGTQTRAR